MMRIVTSGESNVLPRELAYLRNTISLTSSTTSSCCIVTSVGEAPGLLIHTLRRDIVTVGRGAAAVAPPSGLPAIDDRNCFLPVSLDPVVSFVCGSADKLVLSFVSSCGAFGCVRLGREGELSGLWKGCCLVGGGVGSCTIRLGAMALLRVVPIVGGGLSKLPGSVLHAVGGRIGEDLVGVCVGALPVVPFLLGEEGSSVDPCVVSRRSKRLIPGLCATSTITACREDVPLPPSYVVTETDLDVSVGRGSEMQSR